MASLLKEKMGEKKLQLLLSNNCQDGQILLIVFFPDKLQFEGQLNEPELVNAAVEKPHSFIQVFVSYLKEEKGLSEPVVHDGGLSRIVVELLPDKLRHEGLDEQAAAQYRQVVSSEQ